jgi:murein DD-endopeptidase MepM/ murein hydrolase activator NlpD
VVLFAGYRAGYGNIIVLDHKFGVVTRFGHLSKFNVQAGQRISRSDVLGFVGNTGRTTGPHLHFELWMHNKPVNPQKFLAGARRG